MQDRDIVLLCYAIFWVVRVHDLLRLAREPFARGRGWFFDVPVDAEFDARRARAILRRYRLGMLVPFAFDVPIVWALLAGRFVLATCLMLAASAATGIYHASNGRTARSRAREEASHRAAEARPAVVLSLKPRLLRDYSRSSFEIALAAINAMGIAWTVIDLSADAHRDPWKAWAVPVLMLYVQLGALLAKRWGIEWRSPTPEPQAAARLEVREALRRQHAWACDIVRAGAAVSLLFWPVKMALPTQGISWAVAAFLAAGVGAGIASGVRLEANRKRVHAMAAQLPPVSPRLDGESTHRWPACFDRDSALPVLASRRGYSLNLAHRQSQLALAYVAGFAVLAALVGLA